MGNRIFKIILAILIFIISYSIGEIYRFSYYYTIMFVCPFAVFYIIFQVIKILDEITLVRRLVKKISPYFRPAIRKLKNIWSDAANLLLKLAHTSAVYQKFEALHLKNTSKITGYSDEFFRNHENETSHDYEIYHLKWKKCKSNSERVRFLYAKYIIRNRKKGKAFSYANTPEELQKVWGKDDYNAALFSAYYIARYDEKEEITDEIILKLTKYKAEH